MNTFKKISTYSRLNENVTKVKDLSNVVTNKPLR